MTLDDRILDALRGATGPMTATAIAAVLDDGTTAAKIRRRIAALREDGMMVANWAGRGGGYILGTRDDILFVPLASVIAELEAQAAA